MLISDVAGSKKSGNGRVRVMVCRVRAGPGISGTRSGIKSRVLGYPSGSEVA